MWGQGWRERLWSELDQPWDILIVGGGITGAGILRLASKTGLRVLLVEAADFSSGTSSRSSKLVHGGFRYLFNRQFDVTRESVIERERMLREAPHLVTPLPFILPNYSRYHIHNRKISAGCAIYDLLAPKWDHYALTWTKIMRSAPGLNAEGLVGGYRYVDARVDDSRLVLRVLREAVRAGGQALNYARAENLLRTSGGKVCGAVVRDLSRPDGPSVEVKARLVINATGPWTDELRAQVGGAPRLRKLRGSHLVFPRDRFPLDQALTLFHPKDRRAMFAIPWEGVTLLGTTDIDQDPELDRQFAEPFASREEIDYLLDAGRFLFPGLELSHADVISTFAGLRPIVRTGAATPSKESRAHAIWEEDGLLTITGGKLTTFRIMAAQVMERAAARLPDLPVLPDRRVFDPLPVLADDRGLPAQDIAYLLGRCGAETAGLLAAAAPEDLEKIGPLPNRWAEVRWAARQEGVVHLDDLLLRRVRLGMLLPNGGLDHLPRLRRIVQAETGWDDARWDHEVRRYRSIWEQAYSPCPGLIYQGSQAHVENPILYSSVV